MSTSLAKQLQRLALPQTRAIQTTGKKRVSFLFDPAEAANLDHETVLAIGKSGLDDLCDIEPDVFEEFSESLFSETSAKVNRAVLTKEENRTLDRTLDKFFLRLSPYFLIRAAHKTLEWLIFRFHVHEYNVSSLVRLGLPYHDSNTFLRLVQLLVIPKNDHSWFWLLPFQSADTPLPRQVLINRCQSDLSFLGFILETIDLHLELLGEADGKELQLWLTFYASIVIGTIHSTKKITDQLIAKLMPYLAQGLRSSLLNFRLASYMVSCQLCISVTLAERVVGPLLKLILSKLQPESALDALSTVVVICQTQVVSELPKKGVMKLARRREELHLEGHLETLNAKTDLEAFLSPLLSFLLASICDETKPVEDRDVCMELFKILTTGALRLERRTSTYILRELGEQFKKCSGDKGSRQDFEARMGVICATLCRRHPTILDEICEDSEKKRKRKAKSFRKLCESHPPADTVTVAEAVENGIGEAPTVDWELKEMSPPKKRKKREKGELSEEEKFWQETANDLENKYQDLSAQRIPALFKALEECLSRSGEYYKKEYTLQLILTSLARIFGNQEEGTVGRETVRLDLVIRCVRESDNSTSVRAALDLLARLAPFFHEAVLNQVMSVFTFMGTGLVRKDDNYSFQVVEKTLRAVIPPLMKSGSAVLEVFRVFAAALTDIPAHRRLSLLRGLIQASSGDGEAPHLWILLGLLTEHHVAKWLVTLADSKSKESLLAEEEFIQELWKEFDAKSQLEAALRLLQYLLCLSDSETKAGSFPEVFARKLHTEKQLRHFRYVVLGAVHQRLTSDTLIAKLADLESMEVVEGVCLDMMEAGLNLMTEANDELEKESGETPGKRYWKAVSQRTDLCLKGLSSLLSAEGLLGVIEGLLQRQSTMVRKNALDLLNAKLLQQPTPFTQTNVPKLGQMVRQISAWLKVEEGRSWSDETILAQAAAHSLKLLCRVLGPLDSAPFLECLEVCVEALGRWREVSRVLSGSLSLCAAEFVSCLGAESLPFLASLVSHLLDLLADEEVSSGNDLVVLGILTCLEKLVERLAPFLSPYLVRLLCVVSSARMGADSAGSAAAAHRLGQMRKHLAALPSRILIPAVKETYERLAESSPTALKMVFLILEDHLSGASSEELGAHLGPLTEFFLEALELRCGHFELEAKELDELEEPLLSAAVRLGLKLSESSFRPFFFRLTEWATTSLRADSGLPPQSAERLITLYRLSDKLADALRGLFLLFAGHLIKTAASILDRCNFSKCEESDRVFAGLGAREKEKTDRLICAVLDCLQKCCDYDSRKFFDRERFDALFPAIIDQLENSSVKKFEERIRERVAPTIGSLGCAVRDDGAWKTLNYQLLLKTRSKKPKVREGALEAAEALYTRLGEDVVSLLPETVPFLAELLEDGNEAVEERCHKVVKVLESALGESLQQYF